MIADTSDIHLLGVSQRRHADDLATAAAKLRAATVAADAFGPVGAGFLTALNQALAREAERAQRLAEHLDAATRAAGVTAAAYCTAESSAGQAISTVGG